MTIVIIKQRENRVYFYDRLASKGNMLKASYCYLKVETSEDTTTKKSVWEKDGKLT